MKKQEKQDKAKELTRELFDLKLNDLDKMDEDKKKELIAKYDMLSAKEFEYLRRKVLAERTNQDSRAGWLALPRDFALIVFCVVSVFSSLTIGLISGLITLVLLMSIFQVYYNEKLNRILAFTGMLTYAAYFLLGYSLLKDGLEWWKAIGILLLAWGGTYWLSMLAAIPMQLYLKAREKSKPKGMEEKSKTK